MSTKKTKAVNKVNVKNGTINHMLKGFIAGLLSFIILIAVFSLVVLKSSIPEKYFFILVLAASAVSSLIGSLAACFKNKSKNLIIGMSVAIILLLTEFIILLCFNNANLSNSVYLMFPSALALGFIGCIIGANIRTK